MLSVFVKQLLIDDHIHGHSSTVRKAGQIWPLQMYKLKHVALGTGGVRGGEQRKDGGGCAGVRSKGSVQERQKCRSSQMWAWGQAGLQYC